MQKTEYEIKVSMWNKIKNVLAANSLLYNTFAISWDNLNFWRKISPTANYLQEKIEMYICNLNYIPEESKISILDKRIANKVAERMIHEKIKNINDIKVFYLSLNIITYSNLKIDVTFLDNFNKLIPFEFINGTDSWRWGLHPELMKDLENKIKKIDEKVVTDFSRKMVLEIL